MHRIYKRQRESVKCPNLTSLIQKHFGGRETLFKTGVSIGKRESELVSFNNDGESEAAISTEGISWNRDVTGLL